MTQLYSVQPYLFSGTGQSLKNQHGNESYEISYLLTLLVLVRNWTLAENIKISFLLSYMCNIIIAKEERNFHVSVLNCLQFQNINITPENLQWKKTSTSQFVIIWVSGVGPANCWNPSCRDINIASYNQWVYNSNSSISPNVFWGNSAELTRGNCSVIPVQPLTVHHETKHSVFFTPSEDDLTQATILLWVQQHTYISKNIRIAITQDH